MKQVVRIIGGIYRGKKLPFPDVEGLRPTPDRVRETLFNWLMHDIRDARCLDAFAGSGALGFEALSRGSREVVLLEQSPKAYDHLDKIITSFNSPKLKLIKTDAVQFLQMRQKEFDIIFLDPPFAQNYLPQCLSGITMYHSLKKGGLVYIESPTPTQLDETQWRSIKIKKAGQVFYALYEKLV